MDPVKGELPAPRLCKIDPEKEIRILELLPTNSASPCQGRLIVRKIHPNTASKRIKHGGIPYHALSYAWGPLAPRYPFLVDKGVVVHLTSNLSRALQCLRSKHKSQYIWADQICIDQNNVTERNHQVKLMSEVYRQAEEVLIWLGEAPMTAMEKSRLHLPGHKRVAERLINDAQKAATTQWATRGWVVQEALLARRTPLLCVSGVRFKYRVSDKLLYETHRYLQPVLPVLRLLGRRRDRDRLSGLVAFAALMVRTDTRDPRDKIYSILALLDEGLQQLIEPDYSTTAVSVFAEATSAHMLAAHMLVYRDLSILTLASPRMDQNHDGAWPSWVPNYANLDLMRCNFAEFHWKFFPQNPSWCRRQAYRESVIGFDFTKTILSIRGLEFDRIVASITLEPSHWRRVLPEKAAWLSLVERRRSRDIQSKGDELGSGPCPYDTLLQRNSVCTSVAEGLWQSHFEKFSTVEQEQESDLHDPRGRTMSEANPSQINPLYLLKRFYNNGMSCAATKASRWIHCGSYTRPHITSSDSTSSEVPSTFTRAGWTFS